MYFSDFASLETYLRQNNIFGEFTPQAKQRLQTKKIWKTKDRFGTDYIFQKEAIGYSVQIS